MPESAAVDVKSRTMQPGAEKTGAYLPLKPGQTVCTVKDDKGQNCWGHVKQWGTAPAEVTAAAAAGNSLHRCQRCFAIYEGPPQEYLKPKFTK
jgi:hypothetical protein